MKASELAAVGGTVLACSVCLLLGTGAAEPWLGSERLFPVARGLISAILLWVALLGTGRAVRYATRSWWPRDTEVEWLGDLVAGLVVAVPLLWFGAVVTPSIALAVVPLGLVGVGGLVLHRSALPPLSWPAVLGLGLLALLLAPVAVTALAPPTDTDELYWQLAVPSRILQSGSLPGGWFDPVASRPLPVQLLHAALLALGGDLAPRIFHGVGAVLVGCGLYGTARQLTPAPAALLGAGLVVGSWSFLEEAGVAHDNLLATLAVLGAVQATLAGRQRRLQLALAFGLAIAIKYTTAPAVIALSVTYAFLASRNESWRSRLIPLADLLGIAAVAVLVVSPWWIRNLVEGLHPLFPYAGWPSSDFTYAYPEKYGTGRSLADLARLPWSLVMEAETESYRFLGRVHALWLGWIPLAALACWRSREARGLTIASMIGVCLWFALGAQWLRHLLPLSPILCLPIALGVSQLPRHAVPVLGVTWVLLLPPQLIDTWERATEAAPVVSGTESRQEYLARRVRTWAGIEFVNRYLPEDAVVAVLFLGQTYLIERPTLVGSVEDHTPSRFLFYTHGEETLAALREAGASHVLAYRYHFIRRSYPFLDEGAFDRQFREPVRQMEALLLEEGTMLFEDGRIAVWDLDGAAPRR